MIVFFGNNAESTGRLGLWDGEAYPERPGMLECAYYMRTGVCGYGAKCRYNHPRDRASVGPLGHDHGSYTIYSSPNSSLYHYQSVSFTFSYEGMHVGSYQYIHHVRVFICVYVLGSGLVLCTKDCCWGFGFVNE